MLKTSILISNIIFLIIGLNTANCQDQRLNDNNVYTIGRGTVEWKENSVSITDCFIALREKSSDKFEITFSAKAPESEKQAQLWSGFGFQNRDNHYALGLRGGNNNDLYLCRYQSGAKNKLLALEALDFPIIPSKWYDFKIVFFKGNIRVYLNNDKKPKIVVKDDEYLKKGSATLGGGWIETEYKNFVIKELSEKDIERYKNDSTKYSTKLTIAEKEVLRKRQRAEYQSKKITKLNDQRSEISLKGNWLFMPKYQIEPDLKPYDINTNDKSWHVMYVPNFWNPVRNWLHLQDSHLPHRGSGQSDNYREKEYERCNDYTFDYQKTTAAWYRHWVNLPENIKGKKIYLYFSAVSKVADIYVNGNYVGGHIGMFGDFEFDITKHIKTGQNLIAVSVKVRKEKKAANASKNVARAVSVDITNDMLNSLPHGMFGGDEGGIWQNVSLKITNPIHIEYVFANTGINGGVFDISLKNNSLKKESVKVEIEIIDKETEKTLHKSKLKETAIIDKGGSDKINIETGNINPKLWSPEQPNMYKLIVSVYKHGKKIDTKQINIGFRTFEKKGNQFFLNGKPYWLRGANHPPIGIKPNDEDLANKFFNLMHDGNQMITRSHGCPFTEAWMDAADNQGVGISYEGSWPWFMINDIPSQDLIDVWKDEMISLVKKYRNHPSLLIWTINNEMYFTIFYHNAPPDIRLKKWKIVSDMIKEIRKLSPSTAISSDSGYGRLLGDYEKNLKPNGIDDGDIDDRHIYPNWYNRDFFQFFDGEWDKRIYWSPGANPDRPFFSQETSTGYTNNDDGHFNRKYLFNNYVPQAWIGDWAYEHKDPDYTLQRHATMTKELLEVIRRTSPESAGVLLFANLCWFQNVYDTEKIKPYPVFEAVKKAGSPVLVSAELYGRNFYSGTTITPRVCVVNNSINAKAIPASKLKWKIIHNNKILSSGEQITEAIPYYKRLWTDVKIDLPSVLPVAKTYCKLVVSLDNNGSISENSYDILIAEKQWLNIDKTINGKRISVYDLTGETYKILDFLGIKYQKLSDLTEIRLSKSDLLVIANLDKDEEVHYNWEDVKTVCGNGTNVLLIHPGKHMQWLYYDKIASIYHRKGRFVNMHIAEHGTFNEIDAMELSWWQQESREKPFVCRRSYRLKNKENTKALCTYLRPHTGLGASRDETLFEMSGIPLLEIEEKKGRLIASEMETNMADKDPIAARLLINMIYDLLK